MKKVLCIWFLTCFGLSAFSQEFKNRFESIDAQDYAIEIEVNDTTDVISVIETITILFLKPLDSFYLDLVDQNSEQKGMKIQYLLEQGKEIAFTHANSILQVSPKNVTKNEVRTYTIQYSGIPKDGLVISKNKFGERTFFGDNWPTRARNWIASVDHPSDKATVSWTIVVPAYYKVVANGEMKSEMTLSNNRKKISYRCSTAIPTKVMVIGVARFEVEQVATIQNIPVSSWVYPQNKKSGFYDYALGANILDYFIHHFGPYSYEKLANVQSTTRYGGMENASCIFYDENSINGTRDCETLLAHEIAHQWFGNAATELDWPHLWLSEGFATYCTNLYIEEKKGKEAFEKQMQTDRKRVVSFYKTNKNPVIDTISHDLMSLLNANSYQKGAWVLHMLRRKIGDEFFFNGLRAYYKKYQFSNATTNDFMQVMEENSGIELSLFFDQWLRKSGHPKILAKSKVIKNNLEITIEQIDDAQALFNFPLEIQVMYTDNTSEIKTFEIHANKEKFSFPIAKKFSNMILDPHTNLLFEEKK